MTAPDPLTLRVVHDETGTVGGTRCLSLLHGGTALCWLDKDHQGEHLPLPAKNWDVAS